MAQFKRSRILYRDLDRIFLDQTTGKVDAYCCAMAVLFEDLRIEIAGLAEREMKPLDVVSGHRISYFLRRSIASLKEFAHAVTDLDDLPEFASVKGRFNREALRYWDRSVRYFNRYGRTLITPVRHTIGGHFRYTAAKHAIENEINRSRGGVPGGIEVIEVGRERGGFVLHFAAHIANAAITEKVPGTGEFDRKFKRLLRGVVLGYRHGVRATEAIAEYYLWPKFESH